MIVSFLADGGFKIGIFIVVPILSNYGLVTWSRRGYCKSWQFEQECGLVLSNTCFLYLRVKKHFFPGFFGVYFTSSGTVTLFVGHPSE